MAIKRTKKTALQYVGLGLFSLALLLFTLMLGLDNYRLNEEALQGVIAASFQDSDWQKTALLAEAEAQDFYGKNFPSTFSFQRGVNDLFAAANSRIEARIASEGLPEGIRKWQVSIPSWVLKSRTFELTKAAAVGPVSRHPLLWLFLTFGLGILGGLLYILPKFSAKAGIKHDHIYHHPLTRGLVLGWRGFFLAATVVGILVYGYRYMEGQWFWPLATALVALLILALVLVAQRSWANSPARSAGPELLSGWLGILAGTYFIGFYVLLYWSPQHIVGWVHIVDPISLRLSGNPASQWFLYGFLYTVVMAVMGVRMFAKYRHNKYQLIRTASVLFFQTAFAFLIPEILVALNQPWYDFKNIWPLDYDFFFSWQIAEFQSAGALGIFMLFWGILLIIIGVPLMVHLVGKRWYCSWVCGCGGLAETLGDPWRQLSDKSIRAWKFERWIIHGVLLFAIVMTGLTLYGFFSGVSSISLGWLTQEQSISIGAVQKWYGFLIGAGFAGVVGTGFYPLMGNRVWCRFGCPLAAYLGLVQRFQSRFRITTNGGQCISCGNCSTYCEMGIDVRHYAQRGQDIVRASCVGCGVCAAVCPRGVLRLENASGDIAERGSAERVLHISEDQVRLMM